MLPSHARSPPREDKSLFNVLVSDTIYHEDMHHIQGFISFDTNTDSRFINSIVRHSMCNRVYFYFLKYMHSIKQGLHVPLMFLTGISPKFFHSFANLLLHEELLYANIMFLIETIITKHINLINFKVLNQQFNVFCFPVSIVNMTHRPIGWVLLQPRLKGCDGPDVDHNIGEFEMLPGNDYFEFLNCRKNPKVYRMCIFYVMFDASMT